jgi:hypothetical protein
VRSYIANAKVLAKDGLTVSEFGELATDLMRVMVAAMDSLDAAGPKKKAWLLSGIGALFEEVADKCVPLVAYPLWVMVRPAAKRVLLHYAGGAIEVILLMYRSGE